VKAISVDKDGNPDGFVADEGFIGQTEPGMPTRLLVSVLPERLALAHRALIDAVDGPLGVRWVQKVDRAAPRENAPPREFLALGVPKERVLQALDACQGVLYDDARGELWIRGRRGEQVILDGDGLLYGYPDDLLFRDAAAKLGLQEREVVTLLDRDYVKQWYRAEHDADEQRLFELLGLSAGGRR
jgi:hypothetical protein